MPLPGRNGRLCKLGSIRDGISRDGECGRKLHTNQNAHIDYACTRIERKLITVHGRLTSLTTHRGKQITSVGILAVAS